MHQYLCTVSFQRDTYMKALTQKEVISVIRAAKSRRDRCMIVLAYRHGMRTSEVCVD